MSTQNAGEGILRDVQARSDELGIVTRQAVGVGGYRRPSKIVDEFQSKPPTWGCEHTIGWHDGTEWVAYGTVVDPGVVRCFSCLSEWYRANGHLEGSLCDRCGEKAEVFQSVMISANSVVIVAIVCQPCRTEEMTAISATVN